MPVLGVVCGDSYVALHSFSGIPLLLELFNSSCALGKFWSLDQEYHHRKWWGRYLQGVKELLNDLNLLDILSLLQTALNHFSLFSPTA